MRPASFGRALFLLSSLFGGVVVLKAAFRLRDLVFCFP